MSSSLSVMLGGMAPLCESMYSHLQKILELMSSSPSLLTLSAFQLFWGRIYKTVTIKMVFLSAIGFFELGSLVAGVAPKSRAFIVGRAISGLGCAAILGGVFM